MTDLVVNSTTTIPADYITITASRSSGPGGQNVNKLNTRITVTVDITGCPTLSDVQKQRIAARCKPYLDSAGRLHLSSQRYRSQHANRLDAFERLAELLAQAIVPPVKRRKTRVPAAAVRRRLEQKKHRSAIKKLRDSDFGA